jgi:pimeloyl-ACP methyl ester carboxylesterase
VRRLPLPVLCVLFFFLVSCTAGRRTSAIDRLRACRSDQGPTDAYCGSLTVPENRETRQGRTIDLRIIVLPALRPDAQPDPLFFLAGGPGQGAAELASFVREAFHRVQTDRDIVLVDQRGTGKSNPLDCRNDDDSLQALNEPDEVALERFRTCLAGFDADPSLYTTSIAMDDLDDVRSFLGYDRINLFGGSYGTRAALVYLRQHEPRVRSMILDGVAPTDMRLPLYFARDAERALDQLLSDCAADAPCAERYPALDRRVRALFARLESSPVPARLVHPRTGIAEDVRVEARFLASVLHGALYSPLMSSMVPELLWRAAAGDFQGMLALGFMGEGASENMAVGMQLSVVCAEDVPRIEEGALDRESAGTVFARHLAAGRVEACGFWPRGEVPPGFHDPVVSDVSALLLSGEVDPVTPPSWADKVALHLGNSKHVIAPATGHGVIGTGCGRTLMRNFIDAGTAEGLDTSCMGGLRRPAFFLSPAGPDPKATPGSVSDRQTEGKS